MTTAAAEVASHNPFFGLQVFAAFVIYWAPTIYSLARGKHGTAQVALINLWAIFAFPWLVAWVLALTSPRQPPPVFYDYQPYPAPREQPPSPPPAPPPGFEEHTILLPKDGQDAP